MDVTNPFNCAETSLPSQQKARSQIPPQWYEKQTLICSFSLLPKQARVFFFFFLFFFPQAFKIPVTGIRVWQLLIYLDSSYLTDTGAPGSSSITPAFSTHEGKKQMLLGGNNFKHSRAIATFPRMTFSQPLPSKKWPEQNLFIGF